MKLSKSERRERKRFKRKHGMRRSGDSVKILQQVLIKKGGK
jgi:hypothetical protein